MAHPYRLHYWTRRDGSRCNKNTRGAIRRTLPNWYGVITLADGTRKPQPLAPDFAISKTMLTRLQAEQDAIAAGVPIPKEPVAVTPLATALDQWEASLRERDDTAQHVRQHTRRVRHILEDLRCDSWHGISSNRVSRYLKERREAARNYGFGERPKLSVSTSNYYLVALRSFLAFAKQPSLDVESLPTRGAGRIRRSLSAKEFARLLQTVKQSTFVWRSLTGEDRYWLYTIAACTGLRAQELASMTIAAVDGATITVESGRAKNRKRATIPLPKAIARQFARWAVRRPGGKLWPLSWFRKAAEMLRFDLVAAKIPDIDAQGRVFDFHSLRGQFATSLARAGVPLQQAQRLLRHSTPTLTANLYTKLDLADLAEAAERAYRQSKAA